MRETIRLTGMLDEEQIPDAQTRTPPSGVPRLEGRLSRSTSVRSPPSSKRHVLVLRHPMPDRARAGAEQLRTDGRDGAEQLGRMRTSSRGRTHRIRVRVEQRLPRDRDRFSPRMCQRRRSNRTAVPGRASTGTAPARLFSIVRRPVDGVTQMRPGDHGEVPPPGSPTSVRKYATFTDIAGAGGSPGRGSECRRPDATSTFVAMVPRWAGARPDGNAA